jgi:hypothetical protein
MARATTAATAIFVTRHILRFYRTWAFDERCVVSSKVSLAPKDVSDLFRSLLLPMLAAALG